MTITADQAKRIKTFDNAHGQTLDGDLLYMIMQRLVTVAIRSQAFTGRPLLEANLTPEGQAAYNEWKAKHHE